jgi:hypothetical protein
MKLPGKKSGLWKPWKNKPRFSTVPTAPTTNNKFRWKAADLKQQTIVYTKQLTLPPRRTPNQNKPNPPLAA